MADAQVLIGRITIDTATSQISFTNIPQTYRDLIVVFSGSLSAGSNYVGYRFNNDSSSAYRSIEAHGYSASNITGSSQYLDTWMNMNQNNIAANQNLSSSVDVLDYSATNKYKLSLVRSGSVDYGNWIESFVWNSATAVASVQIFAYTGNLNVGTTILLYGVQG